MSAASTATERAAPGGTGAARSALEARWLGLTRQVLPDAWRPGWPVHQDHCFQRILLDAACGGVWYDTFPGRPAYRAAPEPVLRRTIALGEDVLRGRANLSALNAASLRWRRTGGPRR